MLLIVIVTLLPAVTAAVIVAYRVELLVREQVDPSLLTLTVTLPNELTLINTTCTVTVSGTCSYVSGSSLTVTLFTSFPSTLNISLTANATHFTNSSTFTVTLDYNGSTVATDSTLTVSAYC